MPRAPPTGYTIGRTEPWGAQPSEFVTLIAAGIGSEAGHAWLHAELKDGSRWLLAEDGSVHELPMAETRSCHPALVIATTTYDAWPDNQEPFSFSLLERDGGQPAPLASSVAQARTGSMLVVAYQFPNAGRRLKARVLPAGSWNLQSNRVGQIAPTSSWVAPPRRTCGDFVLFGAIEPLALAIDCAMLPFHLLSAAGGGWHFGPLPFFEGPVP